MTLQTQLDRVRAQQTIEDVSDDLKREVFRAAVEAFRKWLSPIRPVAEWRRNVEVMLGKCRLAGDPLAMAELMAVRAAAQLDSTVAPGTYDDLVRAAGLDVVASSATGIGPGLRITVGEDATVAGATRIDLAGVPIVIRDAPVVRTLVTDDVAEAAALIDSMAQRRTGGARLVEVEYGPAPETGIELFDSVHDPWRATNVFSPDLKAHPRPIIEPSTLAATPYPPAVYRPLLPAEAVKRGFISDAQFETVVYALQAITTYLPGSPSGPRGRRTKGGFIIGDGTGVGKTNEICAVILDQWARGARRHIVVVERSKHLPHFQEAWEMLGGARNEVFFQGSNSASEPIPARDGVILTTYALLRDDRRFASLVDWSNDRGEMKGVLAFDEAHNMRNAVEDEHDEGSGRRNQSQQGMRGVELQDALPDAGVVYASATMASDVYNLGYAPRLGLWGQNAPFRTRKAFVDEMHVLDDGALEQICIDLKAAGRYCSRTLSFDGVEYEELVHVLTPTQRRMFDGAIRNWQKLYQLTVGTIKAAGGKGMYTRGHLTQMRRALVEQMLSSFNVDTLIEDMHREIAAGHAPVVQIAATGEARLARLAEGREYIPVDEFRDGRVIEWIEENFPETKLVYDATNRCNAVAMNADGTPKLDPELVKRKQEALRIAEELAFRNTPLDRLLLEFGAENVAEVTGRSIRALPRRQRGEVVGWDVMARSPGAAMADVEAFHAGKKTILVFSLAAGGTGLGYQAAQGTANTRRRVHYVMELGRRAESAVQGLGRTHRANQVVEPIVKMVSSDIPAHAIMAARTLAKIQKMGALSRGHQHATTNAIFEQRVPISGVYAQQGWTETLNKVGRGELGDLTIEVLAEELGLNNDGNKSLWSLEDAIGRLATMTDGDQRALVGSLTERTEEKIAEAIRQGSYNQGMETIRAASIEVVDENRIANANGSTTTYYRLRRRDEIELQPFRRVAMVAAAARARKTAKAVFMRHRVNGRIVLGLLRDGPSGIVDIYSPAGVTTRHKETLRNEPWKIVEDMADAERAWQLETETIDTRAESDLHILSGSLLYNWDKLPKTGLGLNRCRTDDGQVIIGRVINARDLRRTLGDMGMRSNYRPAQIAAMLARVDKGAGIVIDNGWRVEARHDRDYRLVVPDSEMTGGMRGSIARMGVQMHEGPLGTEMVIPRSDAIDVMREIAVGCDMSVEGNTVQSVPAARAAFSTAPLPLAACSEA